MKPNLANYAMAVLLMAWCASAFAAESITVDGVSVHLLLTPSGDFTSDVTEIKDFESWNFSPIMPGIPDGQEFHSYLIKVRLSAKSEAYVKGRLGWIKVKSKERGRILAKQDISNVYFPITRQAVIGFFVQGNVCESVAITASTKTSHITKEVLFECGE
jgi:hypothetical protein